jgi:hypothetical protein
MSGGAGLRGRGPGGGKSVLGAKDRAEGDYVQARGRAEGMFEVERGRVPTIRLLPYQEGNDGQMWLTPQHP